MAFYRDAELEKIYRQLPAVTDDDKPIIGDLYDDWYNIALEKSNRKEGQETVALLAIIRDTTISAYNRRGDEGMTGSAAGGQSFTYQDLEDQLFEANPSGKFEGVPPMRTATLAKVYATTYLPEIQHGVPVGGYTNLRTLKLNVQTDYSELDLQTYGQTVNEIIKLRSNTLPDLVKGDYLYLTEPTVQGTFQIGEKTYNDYGEGEYQVESIRPAFMGVQTVRNPTLIEARRITPGGKMVQKVRVPEIHDVMIYSQSPYATVTVDGKQIDGVCGVTFHAEPGQCCTVTLKLLTNHVTIKGTAAVKKEEQADGEIQEEARSD